MRKILGTIGLAAALTGASLVGAPAASAHGDGGNTNTSTNTINDGVVNICSLVPVQAVQIAILSENSNRQSQDICVQQVKQKINDSNDKKIKKDRKKRHY